MKVSIPETTKSFTPFKLIIDIEELGEAIELYHRLHLPTSVVSRETRAKKCDIKDGEYYLWYNPAWRPLHDHMVKSNLMSNPMIQDEELAT